MYARLVLARAATIAVRYTAIRRQFGDKDAPIYVHDQVLETPTLDYTMVCIRLASSECPQVQYRLLPLISQSFALHFTGIEMSIFLNLYHNDEGDSIARTKNKWQEATSVFWRIYMLVPLV
jgi:hypothetical protein